MAFDLRRVTLVTSIGFALVLPGSAYGQVPTSVLGQIGTAGQPSLVRSASFERPAWTVYDVRFDDGRPAPAPLQPRQGGVSPVAIGAIIGAALAAGLTYSAAATYGENEGGGFCGGCFVQWSVISVPVGAAAGAAVGWGIKRARRTVTAVPVFSRSAAGVVVAASF